MLPPLGVKLIKTASLVPQLPTPVVETITNSTKKRPTSSSSYFGNGIVSMPLILNFLKRALVFLLMACIVLNASSVYALPISQGLDVDDVLLQCAELKEPELREELNNVIKEILIIDETKVDFTSIVNREWKTLKLDSVVDSAIDEAVNEVNSNAGLINRFASSWVPNKAKELADDVTKRAFNSPILEEKLTNLSENVATQISNKLEMATANASLYALSCIQKFINDKYSQSILKIFNKTIEDPKLNKKFPILNPDNNTKLVNKNYNAALGGGSIFVVSLIAQINKKTISVIINRILPQLGERVLARIGGGLIPVVGQVVGGIWLASDIVKSFEGALPGIQKLLKEAKVKEDIRQEIASTAEEQIREEYPQIAREISNNIYAVWLDFQKNHAAMLQIARELPEFGDILAKSSESDVAKISSLVGIALNYMGRSQLEQDIKDGKFERVLSLPEVSYKIIETTHNLSTVVDWANLAGGQIEKVVALEIYKHLSPKDLNYKLLKDILDIGDDTTISKLSLLDINSIKEMLRISKPNLVALANKLSIDDLENLAGSLGELTQTQINERVKSLLGIKKPDLSIADRILKALTGSIPWHLLSDKFGIPLILILIVTPIILLLVFVWPFIQWFRGCLISFQQVIFILGNREKGTANTEQGTRNTQQGMGNGEHTETIKSSPLPLQEES